MTRRHVLFRNTCGASTLVMKRTQFDRIPLHSDLDEHSGQLKQTNRFCLNADSIGLLRRAVPRVLRQAEASPTLERIYTLS